MENKTKNKRTKLEILVLCGVFSEAHTQEIIKNATAPVEFSANLFQERLINGFKSLNYVSNDIEISNVSVLSAPFIGAYPMASKIRHYKGFSDKSGYTYVKFNNVWGIRNFSRTKALKKAIKPFLSKQDPETEKLIVVYCTHTPFIKVANYAKKIESKIRVCLYVPDLPQYMNLSANRGVIYNVAKKYDIASMKKHMLAVDSFVLLTEPMKEHLPMENKPYFVAEGIFSSLPSLIQSEKSKSEEKLVVYTGKLDEKFGAVSLIDSMKHIEAQNVKLVICGGGDAYNYALSASEKDSRILPLGQVTPEEAEGWRAKADVLINPRPNSEEYTKYSFPSKNVEYLLSGKPTVAYMLDGMPRVYQEFIYEISPSGDPSLSIANAVMNALSATDSEISNKYTAYREYSSLKLSAQNIASKIIKLNFTRGK
jgi:glycosyltransferase involved in cell wall biosynthesis